MSPRALVAHRHKPFKPGEGEGFRVWEVFQLIGLTLDHKDMNYHIRSNFWKFYLFRTSFTLGELVSLVKVFRLFRNNLITWILGFLQWYLPTWAPGSPEAQWWSTVTGWNIVMDENVTVILIEECNLLDRIWKYAWNLPCIVYTMFMNWNEWKLFDMQLATWIKQM